MKPKPPAPHTPHVTRLVHLTYPPSLAGEPILQRLIRHFDLTVNLHSARLSMDEGWIRIQVTGAAEEIERAVRWLGDQGLHVTILD